MKRTHLFAVLPVLAIPLVMASSRPEGPGDRGDRLDTLLDAMSEAHGGSERLRAIQGLRMEGIMRTPDGGEGAFIRVSRGPGSLASLTDLPGRTEIRILAGSQGWRGASHDALQPVEGPLMAAMQMQSARLLAPLLLDQYRSMVSLVDDSTDGPLLELELADGATLLARLDPQSHQVIWTESVIRLQGMALRFTTRYGDFREVDGAILAHHESNAAQGVETADLTVTRLVVDPAGSDLLLLPAGSLGSVSAPGSGH